MKAAELPDGSRVLRGKIDMVPPTLNLWNPVMYRILHAHHNRTGAKWRIYRTYGFTHGPSDSVEGATHSLCDTESEDHRPVYNWFLEQLGRYHSKQAAFVHLNLSYTILSKLVFAPLDDDGLVRGWNDRRMPTLAGLRQDVFTGNWRGRNGRPKRS